MCTNTRYLYNRHIRQHVLVSCGKCPSCLQQKANAVSARIRNENRPGYIQLFVTLTYSNECIPYFSKRETLLSSANNSFDGIYDHLFFRIYRDSTVRRNRVGSGYVFARDICRETVILDDFLFDDLAFDDDFKQLRGITIDKKFGHLIQDHDKIGVCYYPDLQHFIARLRMNLKRKYNIYDGFTYYSTSEYGPTTYRPHFHLLISIPAHQESTYRSAITEAWPFCDWSLLDKSKYISIAKDCSSYVASYVNRGADFPRLLSSRPLRSKHSYSKTFGLSSQTFSLPSVFQKIQCRDLRLSVVKKTGEISNILFPKYVLNRYFPLFRGYSRLTDHQVYELLHDFKKFKFTKTSFREFGHDIKCSLDISDQYIQQYRIRLRHAWFFYRDTFYHDDLYLHRPLHFWKLKYSEFVQSFIECWRVYKFTRLRLWYREFDNLPVEDFKYLYDSHPDVTDPNENPLRIRQSAVLQNLYFKKMKKRKVTNTVMAVNHNV